MFQTLRYKLFFRGFCLYFLLILFLEGDSIARSIGSFHTYILLCKMFGLPRGFNLFLTHFQRLGLYAIPTNFAGFPRLRLLSFMGVDLIPDSVQIAIRWVLFALLLIFLLHNWCYLLHHRLLFGLLYFALAARCHSIPHSLFPLLIGNFDSLYAFLQFCRGLVFLCFGVLKGTLLAKMRLLLTISSTGEFLISFDCEYVFLRFFLIGAVEAG